MGPATPTPQRHPLGSTLDVGPTVSPVPGPPSAEQRAAARGPKAGARGGARPGAERPALGNYANTVATAGQSPEPKGVDKRAEKYAALRKLSDLTTLPRVRKCRRVSRIEGGAVHARWGDRASIAGLVSCGSVWACPVCSAVVSTARTTELTKVIEWNADRGGSVALLTLTMRHHQGQTLSDLRTALQGAWRHVMQNRAWRDARDQLGLDGYVRAIEVTDGKSGWHLHIHALLLFDREVTDAGVIFLADEMWRVWSAGLAKFGMSALRAHAVDVRRGDYARETLGKYLNKLAFEAAGGRWKKGRPGGRTPFEILADGLATGLADDLERWQQWEQGSKGMRQLTWSRGLKAAVGVAELTDEEIAERPTPGATFAILPGPTWRKVWREGQEHFMGATDAAGGPEGGMAWLQVRGLDYTPVTLDGEHDDAPPEVVAEAMVAGYGHARRNERWMDQAERLERFGPAPARDHGEDHDG